MKQNQISRNGVSGKRLNAGIDHIIIPQDLDRDTFILNCYRNGKISILTENSERIDNVSVIESGFNHLVFPKTSKELGSLVFWVNLPKYNIPIVVGVIGKTNELITLEEEEFYLGKRSSDCKISISGNAREGELIVTLDSQSDKKKSKFIVNLTSLLKNSVFEIIVDDTTSILVGQ